MNNDLFNELLKSVREGGMILRGGKTPSRVFNLSKSKIKRNRVKSKFSLQNPGNMPIEEDEKKQDSEHLEKRADCSSA